MDMIGKVRRMSLRDKRSNSEIAKLTGLARNTVKKWLKAPGEEIPRYCRGVLDGKLTAYEEALGLALKADLHRPKHGRRSALALFKEIHAQGYRGGYSSVTRFVRAWRALAGVSLAGKAFVPLSFGLGEAFQFDWSDEGLLVGGVYYHMQVSHMKLCASRAFWLVAYPSQGHEMLFDAHTQSFQALGGIARRGIYDNMKTAVDKVLPGKARVVNARFAAMCSYYLFDPDFCNVAAGWEKGVVEKNVQDSRRRIWIEAGNHRFASFEHLNVWLAARCRSVWAETKHPEHTEFSVAEMLELERDHLMPMPGIFDGYVEKSARVSSTCLVAVSRNRYSVPCEWAGTRVSTRLYPNRVDIAANDRIVASHARQLGRGQTLYDWQHYIDLVKRKPGAMRNGAPFLDLPEPLQKLRQSLLRHEGGDKAMAQVLAVVPQTGLEAVLVAVELLLESATPSGGISVEHVRNVIARLKPVTIPEEAVSTLILSQAPLADTARYDRLRLIQEVEGEEVDHA
jgi:transposase